MCLEFVASLCNCHHDNSVLVFRLTDKVINKHVIVSIVLTIPRQTSAHHHVLDTSVEKLWVFWGAVGGFGAPLVSRATALCTTMPMPQELKGLYAARGVGKVK